MLATIGPWIAVGLLAGLMVAGAVGSFLLLAMGRLSLDLDWGRSFHSLGPITFHFSAPRQMVFEALRAPYGESPPGGSEVDVLARSPELAVAAHYTKVHFYTARTVEAVDFEPPERIGFRHLSGPVPYAVEEFELSETDGGTDVRYSGEVGVDFFLLGKLAGSRWVRPQWERAVRQHLEDLKPGVESRARR